MSIFNIQVTCKTLNTRFFKYSARCLKPRKSSFKTLTSAPQDTWRSWQVNLKLLKLGSYLFKPMLVTSTPTILILMIRNGNHVLEQSKGLKAPEGQGCPKCGCFVYHADQIFSKGRVYHKGCFKCTKCHRVLDSRTACDGPDNDIYCTSCYRKDFGLKGYGFGQGGPALISGDLTERWVA